MGEKWKLLCRHPRIHTTLVTVSFGYSNSSDVPPERIFALSVLRTRLDQLSVPKMKLLLLVACALDYSICKHDDDNNLLQKESTTHPPPPPIGPFAPGGNPLAFTAKPLDVLQQTFTPSIPEQFLQTKASTQQQSGASTRSFSFLDTKGSNGKPAGFQLTVQHPPQKAETPSKEQKGIAPKTLSTQPQNRSEFNQDPPAATIRTFNEAKQQEQISDNPREVALINDRPVILSDQHRTLRHQQHLEREAEDPTIHTLTDVTVQAGKTNARQQQGIYFQPPVKPLDTFKSPPSAGLTVTEVDFIKSIRPSNILTPELLPVIPEPQVDDTQQRSVNPDTTQNLIPSSDPPSGALPRTGKTGFFQDVNTGEVLPQQNSKFIQGITGDDNARSPDHDERMSRIEADFHSGKRSALDHGTVRDPSLIGQVEARPSSEINRQETFEEHFKRQKEALERKFSAKEFDPSALSVTELSHEQSRSAVEPSQEPPRKPSSNEQTTKVNNADGQKVKTIDFTIKNTHHAGGVTTQTFRQVIPLRNEGRSRSSDDSGRPSNNGNVNAEGGNLPQALPLKFSTADVPPSSLRSGGQGDTPRKPEAILPKPLKSFNREELEEERKRQEEARLFEEDQRQYREQQRQFEEDQRRFNENRRRFEEDQRRFEEQKQKYEQDRQRFQDEQQHLRSRQQPSQFSTTKAPQFEGQTENQRPSRTEVVDLGPIDLKTPKPDDIQQVFQQFSPEDAGLLPNTQSEQLPQRQIKQRKAKRPVSEARTFSIDHRTPSQEKIQVVQMQIPDLRSNTEPVRESDAFQPTNFDAPKSNLPRQRTAAVRPKNRQKSLKFAQGSVYSGNEQTSPNVKLTSIPRSPLNASFEFTAGIPPPPSGESAKTQEGSNDSNGNHNDLPGTPGLDYPIYSIVPDTSFNCKKQESSGMYADVEAGCQAFHNCDPQGHKMSFLCPNGTVFKQELLICDWWYNVQCAESQKFFNFNTNKYTTTRPRRRRRRGHDAGKASA